MAINLAKPNQALIKAHLRVKLSEKVENLRVEWAWERSNINRAVGVGNFKNFENEFNTESEKIRVGKDSIPSKRQLKKVSQNLITKKLV